MHVHPVHPPPEYASEAPIRNLFATLTDSILSPAKLCNFGIVGSKCK